MSQLNLDLLKRNIKAIMENKKISQSQLAENIGMTQANLSKALNTKERRCFTIEQIYSISQYLGISIDELMGNTAQKDAESSPQFIFNFIVKLLCDGVIRTTTIEEKELAYEPYRNEHDFPDCQCSEEKIQYTAFYFPDYLRISDLAPLSEYDEDDIMFKFNSDGNNTKYIEMNEILKKMLPMIKHYRNKEIPEEAFQMIVNGYIDRLSNI